MRRAAGTPANRLASLKIGGPPPALATRVEFALATQLARTSRRASAARGARGGGI